MTDGDDIGGVIIHRHDPSISLTLDPQDIYRSGQRSRVDKETAGSGIHHSLFGRFPGRDDSGRAPGQPRYAFTSGDFRTLRNPCGVGHAGRPITVPNFPWVRAGLNSQRGQASIAEARRYKK